MPVMKRISLTVLMLTVAIAAALSFLYFVKCEYQRLESPDGKYCAIVESRLLFCIIPTMPGNSGDKPGFVTIYNSSGGYFGTIPIDMVQHAKDIEWERNGASIILVGEWNFVNKTISYWNKEQTELIKKTIK
jgi:hypothetical protein